MLTDPLCSLTLCGCGTMLTCARAGTYVMMVSSMADTMNISFAGFFMKIDFNILWQI